MSDIIDRLYAHSRDDSDPALMDDAARMIHTMVDALTSIRDAHIPDQPAASGDTNADWNARHVRTLRTIAAAALRAAPRTQ